MPDIFNAEQELDVRGLLCPQPILQTKRRLSKMQSGQILKVISNDASGFLDFSVFAHKTGHTLKHQHITDGVGIFYLMHK